MPQKSLNAQRDKLIDSAFSLIAEKGWLHFTMADLARHSQIDLADIYAFFPGKIDLLLALSIRADKEMLGVVEPDMDMDQDQDEETPRDRLFELMMARFDVLTPYKAALDNILRAMPFDPLTSIALTASLGRSVVWMMEAAGIPSAGLRGSVRLAALGGLYLYVMRHWMKDDSADMSTTMAKLDKMLSQAEELANSFDSPRDRARQANTSKPDQD